MKLTMERAPLLKALGRVQSVVERRNTIPILSNLLMSAGQGRVTFSASDLDMQITESSPAQVADPGQITAPAHTLYEIVRELPEGAEVSLSYTGDDPRLVVRAARSRFNLPVLPAGDFPVMSSEGLAGSIGIGANDLIRLIDKTRFAMSTQETRYSLNGLYLHAVIKDGQPRLRAVATDGHCMAVAEMPAPEGLLGEPGVIIPRKTINEARRLLDDGGETAIMGVSAQKVLIGFAHTAMTSKVIDGSFPDYERIIPRENRRVMILDNALFAAAVHRVAIISNEQSRAVKLSVEPGRMTLTVRNMDAGQAVDELEADYEGEPFEVGFNARYILDITAQIGGERIEFRFTEQADGAIARDPALALDPTDAGVQYVLMPLRV